MRLWLLYLRSRLAFPALVWLLLIATFCWVVGHRWGSQSDLFLIATITVPLAAAAMICVTIGSPFGEVEQSLSRPLVGICLGHLIGMLFVAAAVVGVAATAWPGVNVEWRFVRNLLGLTGLGLLFARVLGERLLWAPPLGFAMLSIFQRGAATGEAPDWAWVVQPATLDMPALLAIGLLIAGLALAVPFGPRLSSDEAV
ncbi:MAG TPA: hypothetical protein VEX37_04235 [Thermomicrobiales bacterium]|nr:hypothetical protein [Thermomicrobiales bacterium]